MTPAGYSKRNCPNIKTNRAGYASNASPTTELPAISILTNCYNLCKHGSCPLLTLGTVGQRHLWAK